MTMPTKTVALLLAFALYTAPALCPANGVAAKVCEDGLCVGDRIIFGGDEKASAFSVLRQGTVMGFYPENRVVIQFHNEVRQVQKEFVAKTAANECKEDLCTGEQVIVGGDAPSTQFQKLYYGKIAGVYPENWYAIETKYHLRQYHIDQIAKTKPGTCKEKFCVGVTVFAGGDEPSSRFSQPKAGKVVGIYKDGKLVVFDRTLRKLKQIEAKFAALYKEPPTPKAPTKPEMPATAPEQKIQLGKNDSNKRNPANTK